MSALPDARGIDTFYVLLRASFALGEKLEIAADQLPVQMADAYWDEPGLSSLNYASEVHVGKPSTDVALVGQAWSAGAPRQDQVDVLLGVAGRSKVVRVFGDRQWVGSMMSCLPSPPVPFESMPLVYERAYGGSYRPDPDGELMFSEERNPVGVGFLGKRRAKDLVGQLLPNLEDPRRPIRGPGDSAVPQGFGFIAPSWLPRRSYAGTYDAQWQQQRAPYLPDDFDPRFCNCAHPDLVLDRHLVGGELVEVINASADGPLEFELPVCEFDVKVKIGRRTETPPLNLETVLIEPDAGRLSLSWRGAVSCDKQLLNIESVQLALSKLDIAGRAA